MKARLCFWLAALAAITAAANAQAFQRRATMRGGGGPNGGKCTIEVVVDRAAEVEIRGDTATLRNVSGQPPQWRRFECSGVMPPNPANFRFSGVDGRGRQQLVRDLNRLVAAEPALHQVDFEWQGFEWIDCNDSDDSVLSFVRTGRTSDDLIVVLNATPVVREGYIVGVPRAGYYKEVLNTDAVVYGGSNVGNIGGQRAANDPRQGRPFSLCLTLPPLAAIFLKFTPA